MRNNITIMLFINKCISVPWGGAIFVHPRCGSLLLIWKAVFRGVNKESQSESLHSAPRRRHVGRSVDYNKCVRIWPGLWVVLCVTCKSHCLSSWRWIWGNYNILQNYFIHCAIPETLDNTLNYYCHSSVSLLMS